MAGIFLALCLGIALTEKFGNMYLIFITPLILISISVLSYEKNFKHQSKILAAMLILSLIFSLRVFSVFTAPPLKSQIFKSEIGVITQVRNWGKFYVGILKTCDNKNFLMHMPFKNYVEGMRIKFTGITQPFKNNKNSGFNEFKYWRAKKVLGRISLYDVENLEPEFNLYRLRYLISRWLSIYVPNLTGSYLKAALLGERDVNLNEQHARWGTSHLLAVSGFHVGILILCASLFIKKNILLSVILWSYIFLTGAAASAVRAGLMLQTGILARGLGRPVESINSVCLAGVILILNSPYIFWDVGYRLSILAALSICSILKKSDWWKISTLIFLTTYAEITSVFKTVPLAGIIINFYAPLYFSFVFPLSVLGALMLLLKIPLANLILSSCENLFKLYAITSDAMVNILPFKISYNKFFALLSVFVLVYLILTKLEFSKRRGLFITILISLAVYFIFG